VTVGAGEWLRVTGTTPVVETAPAAVLADAERVFQPIGLQLRQAVDPQRLKHLTAAPLLSGQTAAAVVDGEPDFTENVRTEITEDAVTRYLVPTVTSALR
jgi:hypothetical protein